MRVSCLQLMLHHHTPLPYFHQITTLLVVPYYVWVVIRTYRYMYVCMYEHTYAKFDDNYWNNIPWYMTDCE